MNANFKELFQPYTFKNGVSIKNRITMPPMTTWASNDDYTISDEEVAYYERRVKGVGLVITGCTRVAANGIGFTHEYASYDDQFIPGLKRLADAAKSGGALAVMQIFHAGNKAVSSLIADHDVVSSSAIVSEKTPFITALETPRELSEREILELIKAFGESTRRAVEAGFDGIEIHGAHGFLLQNFFSPLVNQRTDKWGGSLENRLRFAVGVVEEIKNVIARYAAKPFLLGFRISPEEVQENGLKLKDTYSLIDKLIELDVDYLHFSLFNILSQKPINSTDDTPITQVLTSYINNRVPVIAAGQVSTPEQAGKALELGLSLVGVGHGLVINPDWVELAQNDREHEITDVLVLSETEILNIPGKLKAIIDQTKGWFKIVQ